MAIFLLINIININFIIKSKNQVKGGYEIDQDISNNNLSNNNLSNNNLSNNNLYKSSSDDNCNKLLKKNIDYEGFIFK